MYKNIQPTFGFFKLTIYTNSEGHLFVQDFNKKAANTTAIVFVRRMYVHRPRKTHREHQFNIKHYLFSLYLAGIANKSFTNILYLF